MLAEDCGGEWIDACRRFSDTGEFFGAVGQGLWLRNLGAVRGAMTEWARLLSGCRPATAWGCTYSYMRLTDHSPHVNNQRIADLGTEEACTYLPRNKPTGAVANSSKFQMQLQPARWK